VVPPLIYVFSSRLELHCPLLLYVYMSALAVFLSGLFIIIIETCINYLALPVTVIHSFLYFSSTQVGYQLIFPCNSLLQSINVRKHENVISARFKL